MKRNIIFAAFALISLIFFGCLFLFYFVRVPKAIATDMWAFKFPDKYEKYRTIKCDYFDFTNPEFVFIDKMPERDLELMFYNTKTRDFFSKEVELQYTGGTDVKNTTFPQLVAMVKEDCGQFQDGHASDAEGEPEWIYTRAQTEEEKAKQARNNFLNYESESLLFREVYGDVNNMTDEEILKLKEKIDEEGLDKRVYVEIEALRIRNDLYELTDEQLKKVEERYGDLFELSDKELVEKDKQITADWESGDFVLD